MLLTLLILVVSLFLLVKGADLVVDEIATLARYLGISPFVVGLTVVAVGTSLPELMTALFSAVQRAPAIGLGNVIGSNTFNLGFNMALGFLLLAAPLRKKFFEHNALFLFVVTTLFFLLAVDGALSATEGFAFLFLFCFYLYLLLKKAPRPVVSDISAFTKKETFFSNRFPSIVVTLLLLSLGLVALLFGAKYLLSSVILFSQEIGISAKIISLTLVSFGTALPELFVTINATRKGLADVFLGNIIGSNIANLLLILGIASLIHPLPITLFDVSFAIPVLLFLTLLFVHYLLSKNSSRSFTAFLLFFSYGIFLFSLFLFSKAI